MATPEPTVTRHRKKKGKGGNAASTEKEDVPATVPGLPAPDDVPAIAPKVEKEKTEEERIMSIPEGSAKSMASQLVDAVKAMMTDISKVQRLTKNGQLYKRLSERIDATKFESVQRLMLGLKILLSGDDGAHQQAIMEDRIEDFPEDLIIAFGHDINVPRIYLDIGTIVSRMKPREQRILRGHLLLIAAIIEPTDDKIELLQKMNSGDSREKNFVQHLVSRVTKKVEAKTEEAKTAEKPKKTKNNKDVKLDEFGFPEEEEGDEDDPEFTAAVQGVAEVLPDMFKKIKRGVDRGEMDPKNLLSQLQAGYFASTSRKPDPEKLAEMQQQMMVQKEMEKAAQKTAKK